MQGVGTERLLLLADDLVEPVESFLGYIVLDRGLVALDCAKAGSRAGIGVIGLGQSYLVGGAFYDGQKLKARIQGEHIELIPEQPISAARGFLPGLGTTVEREDDRV